MRPETSPCKSCGAPILWTVTAAGRRMPVDAEPSDIGNIEVSGGLVLHATTIAGHDLVRARAVGFPLYLSHFATCPNASTHRNPKGDSR